MYVLFFAFKQRGAFQAKTMKLRLFQARLIGIRSTRLESDHKNKIKYKKKTRNERLRLRVHVWSKRAHAGKNSRAWLWLFVKRYGWSQSELEVTNWIQYMHSNTNIRARVGPVDLLSLTRLFKIYCFNIQDRSPKQLTFNWFLFI